MKEVTSGYLNTSRRAKEESTADERASTQGKEAHPGVGRGPLLQQRAHLGGARLLRRRSHLLRVQGQGQRHSTLLLRDAGDPKDRHRRGIRKLDALACGSESRELRKAEVRLSGPGLY